MSLAGRALLATTRKQGQGRPIRWSGIDWTIRARTASHAPGPNAWADTPRAAEVDVSGNLNLQLRQNNSVWECVEVAGPHMGYGQYTWVVNTDPTGWDIKPVLGLFTYDDTDDGSNAYGELDIELTLWNWAPEPSRIWYSSQPTIQGTARENRMSDNAVNVNPPYTCTFIWQAGQVYFKTTDKDGKILGEHLCNDNVPVTVNETLRMNLWLQNGQAPTNGLPLTVQIASFAFTPGITHALVPAASTAITFADGTPGQLTMKTGVSIVANQLSVPCVAGDYAIAYTGSIFNLTGSSVDTHVAAVPPTGNGTTEALYMLRYDQDNYFTMFLSGGGFYARLHQAGANTTQGLPAYNPVTHAYWRIQESGGTVNFQTSPDRSTWTTHYSAAHSLGTKITSLRVRYECGYYGAETSPGPFVIGGINVA